MPFIFITFIVFVLWVRVKIKQSNKQNSTWDDDFWSREQEANFVRKKDISNLDYIQITEKDLPFSDTATGEEKRYQDQVRSFLDKKMINLSGMTNTDIKLAYGTANFPILSEYDQNFTVFVRNLVFWGKYLHKSMPEEDGRARQILEYAVSLGSDITDNYVLLADIYLQKHETEKIRQLTEHVEQSDFFMKNSILNQLSQMIEREHGPGD